MQLNKNNFYINPRDEISIKKAYLVGKFTLVILPLFVMISPIFLAIYLLDNEFIPGWGIGIGILIGFILAWVVWSLLIVKWKIWAYSRVQNINELKKKAIEEKLIWPDGSWFEKTEIATVKQKQKLFTLSQRFLEKDVFEEDSSIPIEMIISHRKGVLTETLVVVISTFCGIFLLFFTEKYLLSAFPFVIATIAVFGLNKKQNIKKIILNNEGITVDADYFSPWNEIEDEQVYKTGSGSSSEYFFTFFSNYGQTKISLINFKIKPKKLETALRTYRIRYEKSNTTLSQ